MKFLLKKKLKFNWSKQTQGRKIACLRKNSK